MKRISRRSSRNYGFGDIRRGDKESVTIPRNRITIQGVGSQSKAMPSAEENYTAFEKPGVLLGSGTDQTSNYRTIR